jgi:hypothetical protein
MGTGEPTFYKLLSQEFFQTLQSLAHPPPEVYSASDSFTVGEWVCVGRPGIYWGDVGLVRSLSDEEDDDRLTVLLVPRITDDENLAIYLQGHVRPPLRKELRAHTDNDLPLSTGGGEETWILGRDRLTKDGLVLRCFTPWELRKDMVDGYSLYLLPEQDTHFRRLLPSLECSHMPPVRDPRGHFMRGERVHVAGHNGIIVGFDKRVGPGHDAFPLPRGNVFYCELECIYLETWKGHVYCHRSFIVKRHNEHDKAFSLGLKENVEIAECDYFKGEVIIRLRPTAARRYQKEPLVSWIITTLLFTDLPTDTDRASQLLAIPTFEW